MALDFTGLGFAVELGAAALAGAAGLVAAVVLVGAVASAAFFLVGIFAFRSVGAAAFLATDLVEVSFALATDPDAATGRLAIAFAFTLWPFAVVVFATLAFVVAALFAADFVAEDFSADDLVADDLGAATFAAGLAAFVFEAEAVARDSDAFAADTLDFLTPAELAFSLSAVRALAVVGFAVRDVEAGRAALVRLTDAGCVAVRAAALDEVAGLAIPEAGFLAPRAFVDETVFAGPALAAFGLDTLLEAATAEAAFAGLRFDASALVFSGMDATPGSVEIPRHDDRRRQHASAHLEIAVIGLGP